MNQSCKNKSKLIEDLQQIIEDLKSKVADYPQQIRELHEENINVKIQYQVLNEKVLELETQLEEQQSQKGKNGKRINKSYLKKTHGQ